MLKRLLSGLDQPALESGLFFLYENTKQQKVQHNPHTAEKQTMILEGIRKICKAAEVST
ncbi:hypothetical protein [Paenibacillus riograndensis]|uniref:hypothetical protein n=1 Tax=Paenibacillus riograndensis TaxID=483937 RepID=UPI000AB34984|nr:hypothetical protein [Paenibacillus riograndensis]